MDARERIEFVYDGLVGTDSIPVKLRQKHPVDYDKLEQIIESVRFLVEYYKGNDMVPKKLAICFVDIYGAFQFNEDYFDEKTLNELEDIGILLQEMAYELFEE